MIPALGGVPAVFGAQLLPQPREHPHADLLVLPPDEVAVHRLPGREVRRQLPPRAAGAHHAQDRVHDRPARMLLPSPTPPRRRQQRLDQGPLLVGQVRGIARTSAHPHRAAHQDHADTPTEINFSNTLLVRVAGPIRRVRVAGPIRRVSTILAGAATRITTA
jgi:hypothetical protein